MRYLSIIALCVALAACRSSSVPMPLSTTPIPKEAVPTIDPENTVLANAQTNYNAYCAHCHGYAGEGQPEDTARRTLDLGYTLVPPHDASGHTWQHPDQLLFDAIKYGIESPLHLYPMSGYAHALEDDEIFAIINYIKGWWTPQQRDWQTQLTAQFAANNEYWSPTRDEDTSLATGG